jgi:transcriptional regulator
MSSERAKPGTLDLIVLRTIQALGPLHAYAVAARIEHQSGDLLRLNQGTLYPALVRLEQQGKIKAAWRKTESNREARFYTITKSGEKAQAAEARRWRQMSGLMETFLPENA